MIDLNLIGAPAFAVAVKGEGFVYAGVNRRLTTITGLHAADMVGRTPHECMPPHVAETIVARYRHCAETGQAIESEAHSELSGGGRWWQVTVTPVFDEHGRISSLLGVAADITDRKLADCARRENDARMALAMDVLDGGFWHYDVATGALGVSPKLTALVTGGSEGGLSWDDYAAFVEPEDLCEVDANAMARGEYDSATVEYRVRPAGHAGRWLRCKRRLVRDDSGAPARIIGLVIDITEQKHAQAFYESQATTDSLTGIRNRRGFDVAANRLLARNREGTRFGLIMMDLDRFKPVNDRHGHAVGDAVLRETAARLGRLIRPNDVVARLGGDEFAILVEDCNGAELPYLAQRLVLATQQPIDTPAGAVSIGMSVGVATSLMQDRSIADLAERADGALYDVKHAGRGAWKFAS